MSSDILAAERAAKDVANLTGFLNRNAKSVFLIMGENNNLIARYEDRRNLITTPCTYVYKNSQEIAAAFINTIDFLLEHDPYKESTIQLLIDGLQKRFFSKDKTKE